MAEVPMKTPLVLPHSPNLPFPNDQQHSSYGEDGFALEPSASPAFTDTTLVDLPAYKSGW